MSDGKTSNESDLLYGVPAIAAYLGLTEKTVRCRIHAGQFAPTFKVGGTICARKSTVDSWLAERELQAIKAGRAS
jgi:excisionase family DNA binding protein